MKHNLAEKNLTKIVKILKRIRLEKNLSHEKLAEKAGVTRPAISFIESGARKPSLLLCLKISEALEVKFSEIVKEAESEGFASRS